MSRWRDAYNQHNELKSNWPKSIGSDLLFKCLVYPICGPPELKIQEFRAAGLHVPDSHWIEKALKLREIINEAYRARWSFEDTYQAALHMLPISEYRNYESRSKCYRGQRFPWPVIPKLFRCHPSKGELNHRMDLVGSFSETLERKYPGQFDEYQRIAIAQHYGVKTWLVDLTLDPWVALFFASLDGKAGDNGIVTGFSRTEWESLSAGSQNRLGAIKLIKVSGVPRIEAQKALFLDGSHPDLIEQYVGMEIQFRQKDGLIFEDPSKGITKEILLPEDDPFATFMADWESNPQRPTRPLGVNPPNDASLPLSPSDYMKIALSWYKEEIRSLLQSEEAYPLLTKVCDFHARLQTVRKHVTITARSLRRLADAVGVISTYLSLHNQLPDMEEVIKQYLNHADERGFTMVRQIFLEIRDGKER